MPPMNREIVLDKLRVGEVDSADALIGFDLSGAQLKLLNFPGLPAQGVNLQEANLTGANLPDCNLAASKLARAVLYNGNFIRGMFHSADLRGADLKRANLTDANLANTDLTGADLSGAVLRGANLSKADLTGAILSRCNLSRADLRNATLSQTDFRNANCTEANFDGTDTGSAMFQGANMNGAILDAAQLDTSPSPEEMRESLVSRQLKNTLENMDQDRYLHAKGEVHAAKSKILAVVMITIAIIAASTVFGFLYKTLFKSEEFVGDEFRGVLKSKAGKADVRLDLSSKFLDDIFTYNVIIEADDPTDIPPFLRPYQTMGRIVGGAKTRTPGMPTMMVIDPLTGGASPIGITCNRSISMQMDWEVLECAVFDSGDKKGGMKLKRPYTIPKMK